MSGPEHYREAERLLFAVHRSDEAATLAYRAAQVHATLALAAAAAYPAVRDWRREWDVTK